MNIFSKTSLRIIYCYLACLIIIISLLFQISNTTKNISRLLYFDQTYSVSYSLEKQIFLRDTKELTLNPEEIEKLRQEKIAEDKEHTFFKEKADLIQNVIYLMCTLGILSIHYLIIRKTKE